MVWTRQPGVSCGQVAFEIGIKPNLLTRWRREADTGADTALQGAGTPRDRDLVRLKRELSRVTNERDFLREAAMYFAKGSS